MSAVAHTSTCDISYLDMASQKKLKSYAATIQRALEFANDTDFTQVSVGEIKVRLTSLRIAWQAYNEEYAAVIEDVDEEALDHFCKQNMAVVETMYFGAHAKMQTELDKMKQDEGLDKNSQAINVQVQMPVQQNDIKNTWGEFDGALVKWTGFRDRFRAAVHDNDKIDPSFKFLYLTNSLVGRAKLTFGQWQFSGNNYIQAWERLNQMYDQSYLIGREHLRNFIRLPELKGQIKENDLRRMSNVTHEVRRQLQAQGLPVEHWDFFMVHMLHERLDNETARQWELARKSDTPKVGEMLAFLDKQALALANSSDNRRKIESAVVVPTSSTKTKNNGANERGARVSVSTSGAKNRVLICEVCNEDHMLYHCPEFMALNLKARKEFIERRNLCPNCFKRGHGANNCYQAECWKCPGRPKHNSALCPNREPKRQVNNIQRYASKSKQKLD
ncbi:uncharacterized protein [Eurosta solidaginis]|uniref:uncharacterized protein isoform X1 n=2 Tax=Eurosta solidaginis TaxID=178769 RepID=UPI003530DB11